MKREDIIRMAREAGLGGNVHYNSLERFAALVAAAEREACAGIDFRHIVGLSSDQDFLVSQAIRAKGETSSRGQA